MHCPWERPPAGLHLTGKSLHRGEAPQVNKKMPGSGCWCPNCRQHDTQIKPTRNCKCETTRGKYRWDLCNCCKNLHLLDRYNSHSYSYFVLHIVMLSPVWKRENNLLKENILGWWKESGLPVSRCVNADRKTMKSLQANPECQLLNVTPVLPALNHHVFFCCISVQHRQPLLSVFA